MVFFAVEALLIEGLSGMVFCGALRETVRVFTTFLGAGFTVLGFGLGVGLTYGFG